MNEVASKTGVANNQVEQHISALPDRDRQDAQRSAAARRPVRRARPLAGRGGRADRPQQPAHRRRARRAAHRARHAGRDARQQAPTISSSGSSAVLEPARPVARRRRRPRPRDRPHRRRIRAPTAPARSPSNFEAIRTNAEEERKRTTEALHGIYEQATGETPCRCWHARPAERFTEVMQGLKQMAGRDAAASSNRRAPNCARGILELPQETAESAAQMRRVIVDQIEALAELNRIVARHGRGLDAVEPAAARRAASRRRTPRRVAPRRADDVQRRRPDARAAAGSPARRHHRHAPLPPRAAGPPAEAPAQPARRRPHRLAVRPPDAAPRARKPPSTQQPRAEPPRAPAPDAPRPARNPIESLNSLSVDIARMIDHDAAAELWDRYKRGERNVFTRKLYTMQGQKTFDEIRTQVSRRPRVQADGRPLHRASSSACSRKSRATTAARWWRAPISPRRPARSTPCSRTRPDVSTELTDGRETRTGAPRARPLLLAAPFLLPAAS